ncbi:acyl-CoA dehydrogenase family protein [Streptomyces sp. NPDC092370]|uniref:acyl-CoA dehydrogenase family protein n=1 Tax=Streptomyces sp. NPDC092370 TaxID=3366016 RepID=UPI003813E102
MDFTIDAFQRELKTGIRKQLGVLGHPAEEDPQALWCALSELALPALEAPAGSGGLELGLSNSVVAWEELGAATVCGPLWSSVFAIDCAVGADPDGPLGGALPGLLSGESRADVTGLGAVTPAVDGVLVRIDSTGPFALSGSGLTSAGLGTAVSRARIRQAAFLVGMAREALDIAAAHVREREQFGHKLVDFEAVSFPLAALLIDLEASRLAVHRAAWLADTGKTAELAATEVLAGAGDLLATAARTAIHVHGTRGLLRTNRVSRIYLRARDEIPRLGSPRALWRRAGLLRLTGGIDPDDRAAIC